MDRRFASLRSTFSVEEEIVSEDTRFLKITVDAMHTEKNLNNSYFDKDVVDECLDSIKNTPILGFIKVDKFTGDNDFKGHEYVLKKTEDGVEEFYIGRAYGVVPESCNPRWIMKMCDDGIEREFLQVDALMWEKFSDATSIVKRDEEKSESMELEFSSVEGYEDEDGVFHFTRFRFDGFCILGDQVQAAMVGANVRVKDGVNFSMSALADSVRSELNDKFELFNATFAKLSNSDVKNDQGGVGNMSKENTEFEQTVVETFTDVCTIVSQQETLNDYWGWEYPRFNLVDIQGDEVIVVDAADSYRYYGFPFKVEGDKPEIDFENGKRKKLRYEDYEDGAASDGGMFEFGEHISKMEESAIAKVNEANEKVAEYETKIAEADEKMAEAETKLAEADEKASEFESKIAEVETKLSESEQAREEAEANYAQVKAEYDEMKPKFDEYVQAEEQRAAEELSAQKDAAFAEYEADLAENVEFAALKEKKDEMSVEDIEKECAFLYVKMSRSKNKFSAAEQQSAVVGVLKDSDSAEEDGFVLTARYGYIPVSR